MPCLSRSIRVRLFRRGPLSLRELQVFHAPALRGCYLCRRRRICRPRAPRQRRIYRPPAPRRRGSHRGGLGCCYCSPRFRQPPLVDILPFSRSTYGVAGTPPSPSLHLARWSSCPWRVPLRPWSWSTPALGPSGSHVGGAPGCWRLRRLSCCTRTLGRSKSQVAGALGCCRLRRLSCRTLAIPATPVPDRWQPVGPATKAPGYFCRLRRLSCQCSEPLSREPLIFDPLSCPARSFGLLSFRPLSLLSHLRSPTGLPRSLGGDPLSLGVPDPLFVSQSGIVIRCIRHPSVLGRVRDCRIVPL